MRQTSTLADCVKAELGRVLYPPVHALGRYSQRCSDDVMRQRLAGEVIALEEPMVADVVRCMYGTLRYFGIPDPRREALRKEYGP